MRPRRGVLPEDRPSLISSPGSWRRAGAAGRLKSFIKIYPPKVRGGTRMVQEQIRLRGETVRQRVLNGPDDDDELSERRDSLLARRNYALIRAR